MPRALAGCRVRLIRYLMNIARVRIVSREAQPLTDSRGSEGKARSRDPSGRIHRATEASNLAEPERHGPALRRAWGGRLRTYRPTSTGESRLHAIRKALVRGELSLNGFNRWRLRPAPRPTTGWTFTETGQTEEVAQTEIRIAGREADDLRVVAVDETTAEEAASRIEREGERPDLLVACRDWSRHPDPCPAFVRMLDTARARGLVAHVIAALGTDVPCDEGLYREARHRWRLDREPCLRPLPHSSNIERRFGELLAEAGLNPIPQHPVAHCFLDFAVVGQADELPVRLDVEVDGRRWHEELPGHYRPRDKRRDWILKRLGWRPVRFWTDEIEHDEGGCIERIRREAASPAPIARRDDAPDSATEE